MGENPTVSDTRTGACLSHPKETTLCYLLITRSLMMGAQHSPFIRGKSWWTPSQRWVTNSLFLKFLNKFTLHYLISSAWPLLVMFIFTDVNKDIICAGLYETDFLSVSYCPLYTYLSLIQSSSTNV